MCVCVFFLFLFLRKQTRVHTSDIRIHKDTNSDIQVTYQYMYIGYIRIHRSNIRRQEGNKHEMYHASVCISFLDVHGSCLVHTHERTRVPHTRASHTQACMP